MDADVAAIDTLFDGFDVPTAFNESATSFSGTATSFNGTSSSFSGRFSADRHPTPFRIPRWQLNAFTALGILAETRFTSSDKHARYEMLVDISNSLTSEKVVLRLGLCTRAPPSEHRMLPHWAWARPLDESTWPTWKRTHQHDCTTDHVDDWPGGVRVALYSATT